MTEEFHLPQDTHVARVHLQVSNLDRSLQMYAEVLGFTQVRFDGRTVALASSPNGSPLILLTESTLARPKPPRTAGLYHVAIRLPHRVALASLLSRLLDRHVPLQGFADHKVSEAIYLTDPDGIGLELYADRPRTDWVWAQHQIEMATDPLDVDDLLAEAGRDASPWNGIDAKTDIGHIHLQVSDLGRSERFYHDVLGFDVMQRSYPGALFLAAGGYHHHIGLNIWAGRNAPSAPRDAVGLLSFAVAVPNKETSATLADRLARFDIPAERRNTGTLLVHDPDRIPVELVATEFSH